MTTYPNYTSGHQQNGELVDDGGSEDEKEQNQVKEAFEELEERTQTLRRVNVVPWNDLKSVPQIPTKRNVIEMFGYDDT